MSTSSLVPRQARPMPEVADGSGGRLHEMQIVSCGPDLLPAAIFALHKRQFCAIEERAAM